MNDTGELLDLVDEQDNVIRPISRGEYYSQIDTYRKHHQYIRAVNALLINRQGQVWVGIRSPSRALWPGGYDFSMGEHVGANESYIDAFRRGLREELNINPEVTHWREIGKIGPAQGLATFCMGYLVLADQTPAFNTAEFTGGEWLDPTKLLQHLEASTSHKSDLLPFLEHFFAKLVV